MGVLGETSSWCFCSGGGKSERVKGGIFSTKGPAMAAISGGSTGFLIHRNLLLTTHANLPSSSAAEAAEIQIHHGRLPARLVPQRFFITSSILDLTIVGLDILDNESSPHVQQPNYLRTNCNTNLELGNIVYILGYPDQKELTVGEGKVVIATDNLIKFSTDGMIWCPGSAGFDLNGNLAFMVCDPMKRGSSPTAKSSSTSSSSSHSWKKDLPMHFGIPIPIICDWLYQHWEGNLDELCKPKLPLRRLISTGQKSEHSCSSFNMRSVFKPAEEENDDMSSPSQIISKPRHNSGASCSIGNICREESPPTDMRPTREQGIPTPEIYESPRLTSGPVCRKENAHVQLLDINFPPRGSRSIVLPLTIRQLFPDSNGSNFEDYKSGKLAREQDGPSLKIDQVHEQADTQIAPPCLLQEDCCSEVQSSSSPLEVSGLRNEGDGFSSEGETMYSAETMESRNYPSPKQDKFQQVTRSQSCVSYSRWSSSSRNSTPQKLAQKKQQSMIPVRKTHSQAAATTQRSHDFYSPTVSSIMKKRNEAEPRARIRQTVVHDSPRWMF